MAVSNPRPVHGGNLQQAVDRYDIPRADWLDLSTGIAPWSWPVPTLPEDVWQRLPEADGRLEQAAARYYGAPVLPVPGSQWAIQQLPTLFAPTRVWLAQQSYEEYRFWWQQQGHHLQWTDSLPDPATLHNGDIVLVINPNNPDAQWQSPQQLLQLAEVLAQKQGWLIVDEAFMDPTPEQSLLPHLTADTPVIVLRSMGKFFGLAGIRTGFVAGHAAMLQTLRERLGPWAISHPAQWIAIRALLDHTWQQAQRQRLHQHSTQLRALLLQHFPAHRISGTALFASVQLEHAGTWHEHLARQAIWVRHFPHWQRLRFGVTDAVGLQRLATALQNGPAG